MAIGTFAKVYRKLYLFSLAILIGSLLLSFASMALLFDQRQRGFAEDFFRREVLMIRRELKGAWQISPAAFQQRLQEIAREFNWDIALWREGQLLAANRSGLPTPTERQLRQLALTGRVIDWEHHHPPVVMMYLQQRFPQQGVLWLRLNMASWQSHFRSSWWALLLFLTFLGLLLVPFTRYLLRPFRQFLQSVHLLAKGDFSQPIDVKHYQDFGELAEAFNHMSTQLHTMIQQKQRLIADVSHELRSPLTRLRVGLELLAQKCPEHIENLTKNMHEIDDMNRIIQDLLDVSRSELDAIPLNRQRVDLTYLIFESLEKHEDLFSQKQLDIQVAMPPDPIQMMLDKKRFQQVLNNLFANLVAYVPDQTRVDIGLAVTSDQAVLTVRDRGPGLPAEDLEKIFQPFYRSDRSRTRRTGGAGLGLAIVRSLIEAHGGNIRAELPEDGEGGVRFVVTLAFDAY